MDQSVLDAVKKWPDVPAVFGWLSLTARGEWRLHPLGDAQHGGPGQGITNTQILGFIGRNYAGQPDGAWYFQNGPQRVYIELENTPHIWRLGQVLVPTSHTGAETRVMDCLLDEHGHVYLNTPLGLGLVHTLDVIWVADALAQGIWQTRDCRYDELPASYGFVRSPQGMQVDERR